MTLDQVPDVVKENKNIKNPCAYWANLPEDAKERIKNQKKEKTKADYMLESTQKILEQRKWAEQNAVAPPQAFRDFRKKLAGGGGK